MFENRAADTNRELLAEAVALRERVAELFGQPSWAHHVMDETMAHRPEAVEDFYARLVPALTAKAAAEIAVMAARLDDDEGTSDVQLWDWRYYDTQLRTTEYGVDNQAVAAYFPLQQVLDGLFEITGEVFGLEYRPLDDAPVWHPDVRTFSIVDQATRMPIAVVHMDLHPRNGKFGHFAAFDIVRGRRLLDGTYRTPVSAIVANFTKPTTDSPSLLAHDEVVTLFHEFGHVLHQTLTRAETARYSGSNTERDFVEAPSQIMEHWCWQPEVLARVARHHVTGAPMPAELIDQLIAARDLDIAIVTLRQIQFGVLDMGLHGPRDPQDQPLPDGSRDLDAILRRAESISMFAHVDGTFMPGAFGHLFVGYDAGYYGYLWSKVYGDDMFSRFPRPGSPTRISDTSTAPRSSSQAADDLRRRCSRTSSAGRRTTRRSWPRSGSRSEGSAPPGVPGRHVGDSETAAAGMPCEASAFWLRFVLDSESDRNQKARLLAPAGYAGRSGCDSSSTPRRAAGIRASADVTTVPAGDS